MLIFCQLSPANPLVGQHDITSSLPGYLTLSLQLNEFSTHDIEKVSLIIENNSGNRKGIYQLAPASSGNYEVAIAEDRFSASDSYYFQLENSHGNVSYYPEVNAGYAPLSLAEDEEDDSSPIEIISPDPNSQVLQEEVTIAISFMGLANQITSDKTKLLIDDMDVSKYLELHDDFLVLTPPKLRPGKHQVKVEFYKNDGSLFTEKKFSFQVVQTAIVETSTPAADRQVRGRAFANYRSQSIMGGDYSYNYLYSGVRLNGSKNKLEKWSGYWKWQIREHRS